MSDFPDAWRFDEVDSDFFLSTCLNVDVVKALDPSVAFIICLVSFATSKIVENFVHRRTQV